MCNRYITRCSLKNVRESKAKQVGKESEAASVAGYAQCEICICLRSAPNFNVFVYEVGYNKNAYKTCIS
jgi:hypothetical protein